MSDTQTQVERKTVKLWSRCEAATLDAETGEVLELAPNTDPKWLVQDLVREVQMLQQKLQSLEPKVEVKPEETKDI